MRESVKVGDLVQLDSSQSHTCQLVKQIEPGNWFPTTYFSRIKGGTVALIISVLPVGGGMVFLDCETQKTFILLDEKRTRMKNLSENMIP